MYFLKYKHFVCVKISDTQSASNNFNNKVFFLFIVLIIEAWIIIYLYVFVFSFALFLFVCTWWLCKIYMFCSFVVLKSAVYENYSCVYLTVMPYARTFHSFHLCNHYAIVGSASSHKVCNNLRNTKNKWYEWPTVVSAYDPLTTNVLRSVTLLCIAMWVTLYKVF